MEEVIINTDYIKLSQFLKLCSIAQTGGHAKILVQDGNIKVNNNICLERGRKLYKNDIIEIIGHEKYIIK